MSILEGERGDPERAVELAKRLDRYFARTGMSTRRARNMTLVSTHYNRAGRLQEASQWVDRALDACDAQGLKIPAMTARMQGLQIAWERGDHDLARIFIEEAMETAEAIGSRSPGALPLAYRSFLIAGDGELQSARALCEEAIDRLRESAEARRPRHQPRWQTMAQAWRAILELSAASLHLENGDWSQVYDALDSVDALEHADELGFTAVARRHARCMAERVRRRFALPTERPDRVLRTDDAAMHFSIDGQPPVDLSSRAPLQRILALLIDRRLHNQPPALREEVIDAAWPEENLEPKSAASRVYSTIYLLRQLGLDDIVANSDEGYHIASDVLVLPTSF